ncbi:unnamed protein product, partial [Ascophyllum nodosum]
QAKARKKQAPWRKAGEGPAMSRKDRRAKNKAQRKTNSHREAAKMFASSAMDACTRTSEGASKTCSAGDFAGTSVKENLVAVSASVSGSAEECSRDAQAICEGAGGAAERVAALARSSLFMSAGRARET